MFGSYLGDHTLRSHVDAPTPKLFYSITSSATKKRLYLKLVNGESIPQPVDIEISGAKIAPTANLISLSAHDTQATNSIDRPDQVVPVKSALHNAGSQFHHIMPGYSIQVIEFVQQ
jgi:alpha-N-arabinofuranosidase